jgi:tetratricopeptide (TPR) repeat protein
MISFSSYCSKSSSLYRRYHATTKTVRNLSFSKACLLQCCWSITFIIVITVITTTNKNVFASAKIHDDDDDKSTTRPRSPAESATATIRIGSAESTTRVEYHPPFTTEHYPDHIVKVLQRYPTSTDTDLNDDNEKEMQQLRLASWYVDLGVAHRTVIEDDYMDQFADMDTTARTGSGGTTIRGVHSQMNDHDHLENDHPNKNGIRIQKLHAMTAFQEAIRIYETLIRNYRQWLSGMEKQDDIMHKTTTVTTTKDMIGRLIQEYEYFLANTFFALAETYTLVNDDMTSAFQYYRRAYDIYHRQRQIKEMEYKAEKGNNKSDMHIDVHYAHCSMQLGLECLQLLHDMDVMEYEDGDTDDSNHHTDQNHHLHHILLSEIMEKSTLTFDHDFWKTVLTTFPYKVEGEDYDDYSNSKDKYTLELLQDDLRNIDFFVGSDVRQVDMYIGQYILTEQTIVYFSDVITIFRQVIRQHHQQQLQYQQLSPYGDVLISSDDTTETSMIIDHQQTLVDALQNLATCIYQYRPTSNTVAITKAVEYYEEAYDVLSSQIIPSLMQQQHGLKREHDPANEWHSPGSNNEVIRTVHAMIDILFILTEMYFLLGDDERSKERMQRCRTFLIFRIF